MGDFALVGADSDIWGSTEFPEDRAPDLFAVRLRHDEDLFSRWVTDRFVVFFHRCVGRRFKAAWDPRSGIVRYDDGHLLRLTSFITTVLASLLPTASIVVLYLVRPMPARLAIIAVFTLVFSLCWTCFTTGRRSEVFTAIAAYVLPTLLSDVDDGT